MLYFTCQRDTVNTHTRDIYIYKHIIYIPVLEIRVVEISSFISKQCRLLQCQFSLCEAYTYDAFKTFITSVFYTYFNFYLNIPKLARCTEIEKH